MPLDMNPEIRARWTAALRSGNYQQGRQQLYDDDTYCCLGVLCELAREDGVVPLTYDYDDGIWTYDSYDDLLPPSVQAWAGLSYDNPRVRVHDVDGLSEASLVALNDEERWPFARIADAIDGGAS